MIDLLSKSKKIKKQAQVILEEKNIIETLSLFGEVQMIGSYELDIMYDKDIDIVVKTSSPKSSAQNSLNTFIQNEVAQKYEFGDFLRYPRINRPESYIITLNFEYNNEKWEIEIWFFKDITEYQTQLKNYKSQLTDEGRRKIIELKANRKDKFEKSSFEIYKEILSI